MIIIMQLPRKVLSQHVLLQTWHNWHICYYYCCGVLFLHTWHICMHGSRIWINLRLLRQLWTSAVAWDPAHGEWPLRSLSVMLYVFSYHQITRQQVEITSQQIKHKVINRSTHAESSICKWKGGGQQHHLPHRHQHHGWSECSGEERSSLWR